MKVYWACVPFLILTHVGRSVSAAGLNETILTTDADSFQQAFQSASNNPMGRTTIQVEASTVIDFDQVVRGLGDDAGIYLFDKYFDVQCLDYSETNKCTLETGALTSRFFVGQGPLDVSFTGFEFIGGTATDDDSFSMSGDYPGVGGAFEFQKCGSNERNACSVKFTDCDFIGNAAPTRGGAIFFASTETGSNNGNYKASSLSLTGCTFESNTVAGSTAESGGGGICVLGVGADNRVDLSIEGSSFFNNIASNGNGNDILGAAAFEGEGVALICTDTDTSGTSNDVAVVGPQGAQTCSSTGAPSSAPSISAAPSVSFLPSAVPSSAPSASAAPSAAPSVAPTPGWDTITSDDFENGWGSFEDGGNDVRKITGNSKWIVEGSGAVEIRDSGGSSSAALRNGHNVTAYSNLRVSFDFKSRDMDRKDAFRLEYSDNGGTSWKTMKKYTFDAHFSNGSGNSYSKSVDFNNSKKSYTMETSQAKIRFRCDASANNDRIYIDNVLFEGYLS